MTRFGSVQERKPECHNTFLAGPQPPGVPCPAGREGINLTVEDFTGEQRIGGPVCEMGQLADGFLIPTASDLKRLVGGEVSLRWLQRGFQRPQDANRETRFKCVTRPKTSRPVSTLIAPQGRSEDHSGGASCRLLFNNTIPVIEEDKDRDDEEQPHEVHLCCHMPVFGRA